MTFKNHGPGGCCCGSPDPCAAYSGLAGSFDDDFTAGNFDKWQPVTHGSITGNWCILEAFTYWGPTQVMTSLPMRKRCVSTKELVFKCKFSIEASALGSSSWVQFYVEFFAQKATGPNRTLMAFYIRSYLSGGTPIHYFHGDGFRFGWVRGPSVYSDDLELRYIDAGSDEATREFWLGGQLLHTDTRHAPLSGEYLYSDECRLSCETRGSLRSNEEVKFTNVDFSSVCT